MLKVLLTLLFVLPVTACGASRELPSGPATKPPCSSVRKQLPKQDGDLVQHLVQLEHEFSCPIVAEIAQPFAVGLQLSKGSRNLRESLDDITHQAPSYKWYDADGVVVFYEVRLHDWPGNPLNQKIGRFDMPDTLSDLKLYLPTAISSADKGPGGVLNGIGLMPSSNAPLKKAVINNATAREILVRAIQDIGAGFSLLIFTSSHPKKGASEHFADWTLVAGPDLSSFEVTRFQRWGPCAGRTHLLPNCIPPTNTKDRSKKSAAKYKAD